MQLGICETLIDEGTIEFFLEDHANYSRGERALSHDVLVDNLPFRLLLFPGGNRSSEDISLYLDLHVETMDPSPSYDFQTFVKFHLFAHSVDGVEKKFKGRLCHSSPIK